MKLRIKEYREEMHLTQKELAEAIMSSQRNISNWENGSAEPDCETIVKLADFFEISIDDLFGRQNFAENFADNNINVLLKSLTDTQKNALIAFLRELNN